MRAKTLAILLFLLVPLHAQETAPTLTEVQRLQVLNAAKDVEIWKLRVAQSAGELEKANVALARTIGSVTPAGYHLNDKLELEPLPKDKQ